MFMGIQNNFRPLHFALRPIARVDELSQFGYFVVNELYRILGFGSTHNVSFLQTFQYLIFSFSEHICAKLYLAILGMKPERAASTLTESETVQAQPAAWQVDGSERRRQRPKDKDRQRDHYSGKKKSHTDKNLLLINQETKRVVYLSSTEPGKTHDKKLADKEGIRYPRGTTLAKDTGFQGYEPDGVITSQPQKSQEGQS